MNLNHNGGEPVSESYRTIERILAVANQYDETLTLIRGWNRDVILSVDGEPHILRFQNGEGSFVSSTEEKNAITFDLSMQTLVDLLNQRITPIGAKMAGKINSSGNMIDILRFASILSSAVRGWR